MWLETAASEFRMARPDIAVTVSDINTDPWSFAVMQ
jgi:hypothetical protein